MECDCKCDDCGRFMSFEHGGGSWGNRYDFVAMEQITTRTRCTACTKRLGPQCSNARPYDGDMRPFQGLFGTPAIDLTEANLANACAKIGEENAVIFWHWEPL